MGLNHVQRTRIPGGAPSLRTAYAPRLRWLVSNEPSGRRRRAVETEIATCVETMYVEVLMGARPLPRLCRVMVLALRISPPPPLRVISAGRQRVVEAVEKKHVGRRLFLFYLRQSRRGAAALTLASHPVGGAEVPPPLDAASGSQGLKLTPALRCCSQAGPSPRAG